MVCEMEIEYDAGENDVVLKEAVAEISELVTSIKTTINNTDSEELTIYDEIRGNISNGMICSGKELSLNDDHDGFYKAKIESGKYFMNKLLPETSSLMSSIMSGSKLYNDFDDKYFDSGFIL